MRKFLVLFLLSMAFVSAQCVRPLGSPGMEGDISLNQPTLGVEIGEDSEEVISQKEGVAWTRDPFSLPPGVRRKSEMEKSEKTKPQKKAIKVEGVLVSGPLKRVVIDDKILSVGERLENWRVMDIQKDLVILETGEGRIEIPISQNPLSPHSGI
ncbi:MAG: hypothetical protein ACE5NJ_11915 [Thermodesulfobacteriota bacterium]